MGMAAAFSMDMNDEPSNNLTEEQVKKLEERRKLREQRNYEKRMKSKGLTKFEFSGHEIWALNESSAEKKAKKKGLI